MPSIVVSRPGPAGADGTNDGDRESRRRRAGLLPDPAVERVTDRFSTRTSISDSSAARTPGKTLARDYFLDGMLGPHGRCAPD